MPYQKGYRHENDGYNDSAAYVEQGILPCEKIQCRIISRECKGDDISDEIAYKCGINRCRILGKFIHAVNHLNDKAAAFDPEGKCPCGDFDSRINQHGERYD